MSAFAQMILMMLLLSSIAASCYAKDLEKTEVPKSVQDPHELLKLRERIKVLYSKEKFDVALPLMRRYVKLLEKDYGDLHVLHDAYCNISELLTILRQPSESLEYWHKAKQLEQNWPRLSVSPEEALVGIIGIGFEMAPGMSYPEIYEITPDSPAQLAGLRKGDSIVAADGVSTLHYSKEQIVKVLTGKPNTQVAVTVKREANEFTVEITRRKRGELLDENFRNSFRRQR